MGPVTRPGVFTLPRTPFHHSAIRKDITRSCWTGSRHDGHMHNIPIRRRNPLLRGVEGESKQIIARLNLGTCVRGTSRPLSWDVGQLRRSMATRTSKTMGTGILPNSFHFRPRDRIPIREPTMTFHRMSEGDPPTRSLAPALPITTICAKLTRVGGSECAIPALAHSADFVAMRNRSHQICFFAH
jgi:hypothetical protein